MVNLMQDEAEKHKFTAEAWLQDGTEQFDEAVK